MTRRAVRRIAADRAGSVSVETALVVSLVLLPLALGAMDLATVLTERARLDHALQAGLFYAWSQNGAASTASVQTAAIGGYAGAAAPAASAGTATYCVLPAVGFLTGDAPDDGGCPTGLQAQTYVSLSVSSEVALPFPVPFLPATLPLASAGMARVQ